MLETKRLALRAIAHHELARRDAVTNKKSDTKITTQNWKVKKSGRVQYLNISPKSLFGLALRSTSVSQQQQTQKEPPPPTRRPRRRHSELSAPRSNKAALA